jgi:hypothetical protein
MKKFPETTPPEHSVGRAMVSKLIFMVKFGVSGDKV